MEFSTNSNDNKKEIMNFFNNKYQKTLVNQATNTTFLIDKNTNSNVLGKFMNFNSKTSKNEIKLDENNKNELKIQENPNKNMKSSGTDPITELQNDRNIENLKMFKEKEEDFIIKNEDTNFNNEKKRNFLEESLDFLMKNNEIMNESQLKKPDFQAFSIKPQDLSHISIKNNLSPFNILEKNQSNSLICFTFIDEQGRRNQQKL